MFFKDKFKVTHEVVDFVGEELTVIVYFMDGSVDMYVVPPMIETHRSRVNLRTGKEYWENPRAFGTTAVIINEFSSSGPKPYDMRDSYRFNVPDFYEVVIPKTAVKKLTVETKLKKLSGMVNKLVPIKK